MTEAPAVGLAGPPPTARRTRRWAGGGWGGFAIRRISGLLASLAILVLLTFLIIPLLPGDPAAAVLGSNANATSIAAVRSRLGLDLPLGQQFLAYLARTLTGDLGTSFRYGNPVAFTIATKLPYTVQLALGAIVVAVVVSFPLGIAVGVATRGGRRSWLATGFGLIAGFFASFPAYVAGTILIIVFAVGLRVLPAGGADTTSALVLPIAALALGPAFAIARVVRQEIYSVLELDYMRTARGHRLRAGRLYLVHAAPNILASTLTLTGLVLTSLLGGAIVIETVFNYPGLGSEVVQAIIYRDYPVIQGSILVIGATAIVINLAIDVVLAIIDPRVLDGGSVA